MAVRASLGPPAPAVPGQPARLELTVENSGQHPEEVRLGLEGEPASWGWITPPVLSLAPRESAVAVLTFKVPRAPSPPAGPLPITVSVGGEPLHGTLDVAPFVEIYASLDPRTSRGRRGGRHVVTVENRGNARLEGRVEARGEELSAVVDPDRIDAGPGESVHASLSVRADHRPLRGRTTTRSFDVVVRPAGPGAPARVEGAVELAAAGWTGRIALAVLALAVAAVAVGSVIGPRTRGPEPAPEVSAPSPGLSECPGRGHLSPDANGIVRADVKPPFDYSFLFVGPDGCRPARFNPCAPVRYTLNRRLASDADVAVLEEALRKTSGATGIEFRYAGPSNEDPLDFPRPVRNADGSFAWPPVLIGWAHLGTGEELRRRAGVRTQDAVVGGGGRPLVIDNVIATGNLVLNLDAVADTDTNRPVPHGFGNGVNWGRIMLHELGHVLGLGHVESRTSLMNEALTQQTISSADWGVGDLIGLRHLGREAGCLDVPPVPVRGAPR